MFFFLEKSLPVLICTCDEYFLKCRCMVGVSLMARSGSGVWLSVWVWHASFWHLASHVVFDWTSNFSCKSSSTLPRSEGLAGFFADHLPCCSSLASIGTTAVSCLSHCTQVAGILGASASPRVVSHRAKSVNISKAVCEVLNQFWIGTQHHFLLISSWFWGLSAIFLDLVSHSVSSTPLPSAY